MDNSEIFLKCFYVGEGCEEVATIGYGDKVTQLHENNLTWKLRHVCILIKT